MSEVSEVTEVGALPTNGAPSLGDERDNQRELFDAFYPRLAGWTRRLVDDPETAHDIATEAFVRLLGTWGTVREPRSWLFMTVSNLVRDHWRKTARERVAYLRLVSAPAAEPRADQATTLTVRQLVQQLPDRLRVPVLLHYYADLPITRIAEITGKAEGTVKRALHDARALMAGSLREGRP